MPIGQYKHKKLHPEVKEKIRISMKKHVRTEQHNRNISRTRIGKSLSEANRKALSLAHKKRGTKPPSRRGTIPWNYEGKTILQEQIRKSFEYRQWRSDVFTRDKFTCVRCGQKGSILNADHIKEFAKIISEYGIKTFSESLSCGELWNTNNGRTLCVPCHRNRKQWDDEVEIVDEIIYHGK